MSTLEFVLVAHAIIVGLAVAVYVKYPPFKMFVIAAMLAQVLWRGLSQVVGN